MAIKLIAIDMDGTLLNPQSQVSEKVAESIFAARKQGVKVVLTTGRPYIGVQHYLQLLDLQNPGDYCITNNGALVQEADSGRCLSEITLSFDDYLYFESLARELNVHFHALSHRDLYTANRDISRFTVLESHLSRIPLHFRQPQEMDKTLTFPKVMMIDEPEIIDRAIAQMPAHLHQKYTIMKSAEYYLEILDKRVNKGAGVKALAERLSISRQEVMAIGDQENDLAMLEYAGLGVAMGNGIERVKAISQFVTRSNAEDGVAHAINQFVLTN
jgi:Cof subfamily protein (haloacid dehalogenase superfamily)